MTSLRANAPGHGQPNSWFRVENSAAAEAEVFLYDEIGAWGISAADFVKELRSITAPTIQLRISSPGGDVFDGIAIYNALRNHRATVNVTVDGIAASAASFISQAGDRITMARNAQMMIHEGHGVCVGNSKDMAAMTDLLDKCSDNIADIYAQRAGGTVADWRARMRAETWYTAAEAVKAGLADEVATSDARVDNSWDLSIFNFAGRVAAPDPFGGPIAPVPADNGPDRPEVVVVVPLVVGMVCPSHDTAVAGGTWDADAQQGRLPSPMPMATGKKMYAWMDEAMAEAGMMPKSAGKLPHHEVSSDGTPGAANLAGVRNALARLSQSDIPEADQAAVQAHLRAHLAAGPPADATSDLPLAEFEFDPETFRDSIRAAAELPFDPDEFRDTLRGLAFDAPAAPTAPLRPVDLGPAPAPAEPIPELPDLSPWDQVRAAVRIAANDAPAPPQPHNDTESPADEPGFFMDAAAFQSALRRAKL